MRYFQKMVLMFGLMLAVMTTPAALGELKVGDVAPPVTVTDWVKGKPMDIVKDGRGKVIVLEFWATWCGPCIQLIPQNTALYKRYKDKGLVFVGVTDAGQGQQLKSVRDFVTMQGDRMDYPIAFDNTQKTNLTYIVGTGAMGIPHAVVIGKDGRIAWIGHPLEPLMESTIKDLLLDRFDAGKAAREAEVQAKLSPLLNEFNVAVNRSDWDKCLSLTDQMLKIDPANFDAMRFNVYIFMEELRSQEKLKTWVGSMVNKHGGDAKTMAILSTLMLAMPDMTDRQPELAVQAANAALSSSTKTSESMEVVAQTFYQLGLVDSAIDVQREAVGLADEFDVAGAKDVLGFYERCKAAQAGIQR